MLTIRITSFYHTWRLINPLKARRGSLYAMACPKTSNLVIFGYSEESAVQYIRHVCSTVEILTCSGILPGAPRADLRPPGRKLSTCTREVVMGIGGSLPAVTARRLIARAGDLAELSDQTPSRLKLAGGRKPGWTIEGFRIGRLRECRGGRAQTAQVLDWRVSPEGLNG